MKKELSLQLPDDLHQKIKLPEAEVPTRLKKELAVRLYAKGLLTFAQARELAEMTRWAFRDLLSEEEVPRRYDVAELEDDLVVLDEVAFNRN
jgi:predicted HTH domain antitoxin